jgi:hypothetical protein
VVFLFVVKALINCFFFANRPNGRGDRSIVDAVRAPKPICNDLLITEFKDFQEYIDVVGATLSNANRNQVEQEDTTTTTSDDHSSNFLFFTCCFRLLNVMYCLWF